MSLFAGIVRSLEARGVRFALVGAEALALHGIVRATADRDLLTTDPRVLEARLWAPLVELGAEVEVRRGDAEDPLAGVVRFRSSEERDVDLVVGRPGWMTHLVERAGSFELDELRLPVPSRADLVLLKLYAGGPQDAWDVVQLLESPDRAALVSAVEQGLGELPADARGLWSRILEDLR